MFDCWQIRLRAVFVHKIENLAAIKMFAIHAERAMEDSAS